MPQRLESLLSLSILCVAIALPAAAAIPAAEREALVAFYDDTGGPGWTTRTNWLGAAGTECTWVGVRCDPTRSTVTGIGFIYNNLRGRFPASVLELPNLKELVLNGAALSGAIPPEIGQLKELTTLQFVSCGLTGAVPPEIGALSKLESLALEDNELSGEIPRELAMLGKLRVLTFYHAAFTTIPPELASLTSLEILVIRQCGLEGGVPPAFAGLTNLTHLDLSYNRLTGPIPDLSGMTRLEVLMLEGNAGLHGSLSGAWFRQQKLRWVGLEGIAIDGSLTDFVHPGLYTLVLNYCNLTGEIPVGLTEATGLYQLFLIGNRFTGPIPEAIYDMPALEILSLRQNRLTGGLAPAVGRSKLHELNLSCNLLTGPLPRELASLPGLSMLALTHNNFRGDVPAELKTLATRPYLSENALTASDPALLSFLDGSPECCSFSSFQTVPPADVAVSATDPYAVTLQWTPRGFIQGSGGHQVLVSTTPGGPYTPVLTTSDKYTTGATVIGLAPATRYYFVVKTVSFPHGGAGTYQANTIFSDPSPEVVATTKAAAQSPPSVIVSAMPSGLTQVAGVGGAAGSYSLTNVGGSATTVTLTQTASFFTQSPEAFVLEPGATQVVTLASATTASGSFDGESVSSGLGAATRVRVTMVSAERPSGAARVVADRIRLDLVSPAAVDPTGEVVYTNLGDARFDGVVATDVEFLAPEPTVVSIAPGASVKVVVTSNRQKRPDAALLNGSQEGRVTLVSIGADAAARSDHPLADASAPSLAAPVSVTDTVKPPTSVALIPDLAPGETALVIPGVGHVTGSVGTFITDLTLFNSSGSASLGDMKLFFQPLQGSAVTQAALNAVPTGASVGLADVVGTVFGDAASVGTLHVRSTRARDVVASASVFNTSNPAGNYGASIPVFRSDRGAAPGEDIVITGLRKNDTGHTNLFIQELEGKGGDVETEFIDVSGSVVGRRTDPIGRFAMVRLLDPAAAGTVAVRVRNLSAGSIAAYATPVDRASGDTWAVTEWSRIAGYEPGEPVVIPIGGSVRGANETHFRTDVAITNRCTSVVPAGDFSSPCRSATSGAVLRFVGVDGSVREKRIALGLLQTAMFDDVLSSAFGVTSDLVGHFLLIPESGEFSVSSRTYTITRGAPATYGSSVPALGISTALRSRQARRICGLEDTTRRTILGRTPATSRTNFGMVEVSGAPATVRVSVYFNEARSVAAVQLPRATKDFELQPMQLLNVSNLVESVFGPARETTFGDLSGVQVSFEVLSPTGAVMVYSSSVDNGTGDSVIRTE